MKLCFSCIETLTPSKVLKYYIQFSVQLRKNILVFEELEHSAGHHSISSEGNGFPNTYAFKRCLETQKMMTSFRQ
ncbi:hypothetical protein chiPu_0003446 [Chiloscyllium punctatum]|uniref:Uncharacterized protein n=1 Tax=Chiloscyllium punctatum TaxID=137246 RepID=A0A401S3U7_CHIPU|nr:hypothetical protein [Chiloscyllium punctatum]